LRDKDIRNAAKLKKVAEDAGPSLLIQDSGESDYLKALSLLKDGQPD
jgi:hypothetical protein